MLGHEPSGVIDAVGPHVQGLKVGDRVTSVGVWGCFADYIVNRADGVLKLPPEISLPDGSLVEVLPGVMLAATRTGITPAHDVLVLGQGLSGLLLTRLVALNGCKRLLAADLFDEELAISKEFGAGFTINAARVQELCPGGVDVTIMTTLDGNDVPKALEWTRPQGKIVLYGSIGPCGGIDFFKQHIKGISIVKEATDCRGLLERRRCWREAMGLVADGLLPTERLRTHVFPMERLLEAMSLRATPRADVIHVVMKNDWVEGER